MLLTHGQGFTALLGKKPTSFVDRILPWKHREITELRTSGWLRIHDSETISLQHRVAANLQPWLTIGEIMAGRMRERGSIPNFSLGDDSDLWTLERLNPYKQQFLEATALSSPHRRLMMLFFFRELSFSHGFHGLHAHAQLHGLFTLLMSVQYYVFGV